MRKVILSTLFIILLFSFRDKEPFYSKNFSIENLAPGVWAAIANDNYGHAICNAGIIDLGDKTIVFDPFMNLDAASDLKTAAIALTKKQVQFVVNSHFHNDHIRSNQIFSPTASIISTVWTRNQESISEPEERAWEKQNAAKRLADSKEKLKTATGMEKEELPMWIGYYEGLLQSGPQLKTVLPDITFTDSLWIYGSKRSIELIECKNGHTGSDVILVLPKEKIIFMGDLLFVKRHPWLGDGDPKSWQQHLEKWKADENFSKYVPGHGPVGGKQEMNSMIDYLKELHQLVSESIQKNLPDSFIVKSEIPQAFKEWKFAGFYSPNLQFLCEMMRKK